MWHWIQNSWKMLITPCCCCHKAVQICHSLETYNSVMQINFILMLRTLLIGSNLLNKSCTFLTQHVPNVDTSLPVSKKMQRRCCTVHVSCCKSISQKLDSNLQWSIHWPMYAVFPQCRPDCLHHETKKCSQLGILTNSHAVFVLSNVDRKWLTFLSYEIWHQGSFWAKQRPLKVVTMGTEAGIPLTHS